MRNAEDRAVGRYGSAGQDEIRMSCPDCIFWYRCKLGRIDCERKER